MSVKINKTHSLIRATVLSCFLLFVTEISAQPLSTDQLSSLFNDFAKRNLREKIYTHTDKDLYIAGEIIWFKIYNVGAGSHMPLDLSKIAYAEIIDQNNKPVLQAKIALKKGSGNGSLQLPVSLASGTYQLRAYTNWMKNGGPEYFFEKHLTVVNALVKPGRLTVEKSRGYDIQFFPEGGNLVDGLRSKVAFRATDSNGKGLDLAGAVVDGNGDTIARFSPLRSGIGNFHLTPAAGKMYKAVINVPDGPDIIKPLPSNYKTGYVISLNEGQDSRLNLTIQSNEILQGEVLLLVHTRQETKISARIPLSQGKGEFLIDKGLLGDGISHLTIFSTLGQPLCERLYFKKPLKKLAIAVKPDQSQYASRKKVTLTLESKDETGRLTDADASIAVYATSTNPATPDIASYLWLQSDLRGNVEDPAYYFKNDDLQSVEAVDNLMLTHGWRRFVWNEVLSGKPRLPEFLPEIEGHIISGRITDVRTNTPAQNIMGHLSVPGRKLHLYAATSNAAGNVKFFTKDISGPVELVAQNNVEIDSIFRIDISSPFYDKYLPARTPFLALPQQAREQVLSQSVSAQVQNAYIGNKLNTFYTALQDSSSFYMKPSKTYLLDNFVRFNTMEEVLREYVLEVPISRKRDNFLVWVAYRAYQNESIRHVKPLLLLDGVPIFDTGTKIVRYDPKKIRSIEVLDRSYFHGPLKFNSIVHFKSYKGNLPDFQLDNRATIMDYEGTQLKREFYSPVYDTQMQAAGRMPDFRNLLYWAPDIDIDKSGTKTLSFYTSDQKGNYTIVVQGITSSGTPGTNTFNIEVK
ncbi:hypothetical protein [Daejeonella sp.]|uniref:hypothetical protein n=1 Tax=Daejeonella sp. TaxID=2805397 RepID=UPI0030C22696